MLNEIEGYYLHSDLLGLDLVGEEHGRLTSVKCSRFDAFIMEFPQRPSLTTFTRTAMN